MANQTDILNRLRDYEVSPPPEVSQRLFARLQAEEAMPDEDREQGMLRQLQQLEVPPPFSVTIQITNAVSDAPSLSFLQETETAPPANAFSNILQQVTVTRKAPAITPPRVIGLNRYKAIAAVLLLAFAGWAIYRLVMPAHPVTPQGIVQKTTPTARPRDSAIHPADATQAAIARYQLYDNIKTENYFRNNRFVAEGAGFTLSDNDFFVTFASFRAEDLPAFLTEEDDTGLLLRLDQYSYFSISPKMMDMLKTMYRKRGSGKPTRRARKERERLEEWKLADGIRFDAQARNPLDPVDLAEFIFK